MPFLIAIELALSGLWTLESGLGWIFFYSFRGQGRAGQRLALATVYMVWFCGGKWRGRVGRARKVYNSFLVESFHGGEDKTRA